MNVMIFGVGAFAHAAMQVLKENGTSVSCYVTSNYGHYGASLVGEIYLSHVHPNPVGLIREHDIRLVIPMSIDWHQADWAEELLSLGVPIFSPSGAAMRLERERDFARQLCAEFGIPFPKAYVARNRLEAQTLVDQDPRPYVIKNPLCSPTSPIHTIVCETVEDTRSWLQRVNYAEGVFLQEYAGCREAGHIALVSGGEIYSLVTNQEYKRAFDGNMGIVAGAPLGGIVEQDPDDRYGLARELLHPLLPWFREVGFHGPVQVTAARRGDRWCVLEYNVRTGVTSGPIILRMLKDPLDVLLATAENRKLDVQFHQRHRFGCSLTLAGYGYPFVSLRAPRLPVELLGEPECDLWWNQVAVDHRGKLFTLGHRIADVVALSDTLEDAIQTAYANIRKIRCLSSYYRTDIGKSLWPPGSE
jgi:phosphoribosylamine-glycine ligase